MAPMLPACIVLLLIAAAIQYYNPKVVILHEQRPSPAKEKEKRYLIHFPTVHIVGAFPWNLFPSPPVQKLLKETLDQVAADSTQHLADFFNRYSHQFDLDYAISRQKNCVVITYTGSGILQDGMAEAITATDVYPDFMFEEQSADEWGRACSRWDIAMPDDALCHGIDP